ncbi:MAG: endonuclease/exonuclease/phosphatase family protein [Arenicella sp.]|nr:endonuclease/exonuclease/phosphatase family protein [Arenicella sp.]
MEIATVQGSGHESDYAGQTVKVAGVVTSLLRYGFYLQSPTQHWDGERSNAIFVYGRDFRPALGTALLVSGEVTNYFAHDLAKPVTQMLYESHAAFEFDKLKLEPIDFNVQVLSEQGPSLANWLNSVEGMLIRIPAGSRFISPSNAFGDYVVQLDDLNQGLVPRQEGGLVVGEASESTWFPGFRVIDYAQAQVLDVGTILKSDVVGALHYRVDAYQLSVNYPFEVEHTYASSSVSSLSTKTDGMRVMTLNCFNLDPRIESADKVMNPRTDVDDDHGDGRFLSLAKAIVVNAKEPDVVALQEIQDSDGAELTDITHAKDTYELLIKSIGILSKVPYRWVDLEPELNADGGQPGGNIRNGFLYRTDTVSLNRPSVRRLGNDAAAFIDSRKPLCADFVLKSSQQSVSVINVHLASKRHQESAFSPHNPGYDPKDSIRHQQGAIVLSEMDRLAENGKYYYVTGDVNDGEHSETLALMCSHDAENLVFELEPAERFDYNHRGKLQVLMHGLASGSLLTPTKPEYEILHGNELIGVVTGEDTDKASDHAYVMARLSI